MRSKGFFDALQVTPRVQIELYLMMIERRRNSAHG
jgi:hypothetical protein